MSQKPLLLTGPYLAMWLWLAVPLGAHIVGPHVKLPDAQINVHLGAWVGGPMTHGFCRYAAFDSSHIHVRLHPTIQQSCSLVRFIKPNKGKEIASASYEDLINKFREEFR